MLKPRPLLLPPTCLRHTRRSSIFSRNRPGAQFGAPPPEYARVESAKRPHPGGSQTRVGTVFVGLVTVGVLCTAYGIYDFYSLLTMWPPELRSDLRAAVKAKHNEDNTRAEAYFRKALKTAETMPDSQLDLLKRTGISISLAEILPRSQAYELLSSAHARMQRAETQLSAQERVRALALAVRLAELAPKPADQEQWSTRAVEDALRVLSSGSAPASAKDDDGLQMPDWVQRTDVAVPLERLGALYASRGQLKYAMPLYLKAIDVMGAPSAGAEDRCRAGQLMNNLAEAIVSQQPTKEHVEQARAWAGKGIAVAEKARRELKGDEAQTCDRSCAVLLFNLGQLSEMLGDVKSAQDFFVKARARALDARFGEGAEQAASALMRIKVQLMQAGPPSGKHVESN
ncbi:hypothetical protein EXIGLDRAFT_728925 [Exidia glandulosa HHB12029]|uniref:TPR-like protein n=1 Tax=Exidia glandulosa HHB12029 TaxID=1314781 RepID=A0A165LNF5_EXIGL|nr:hypothetical protein EXIGLDRAFT_728925 [Exidia glandulosa HHB12029]